MNDFKFGNFLNELRSEKGLSQSELGEMFGVSNKAVSKWEMGVSKPRPAMLLMLASFFGVTVEELLAGERSEKTETTENNEKDDTSLKLWTGEYLKKKKHAKNTVITAFLIPIIFIICAIIIVSINPDDDVVGPIILVASMFAEVIDIALIFVFYGSARKLKRIFYATYPERAEEITAVISPKKEKRQIERVPPLKWEKICFIIGGCISVAYSLLALALKLLDVDYDKSDTFFIITRIFLVVVLTLTIVPTIHYYFRTRRKK